MQTDILPAAEEVSSRTDSNATATISRLCRRRRAAALASACFGTKDVNAGAPHSLDVATFCRTAHSYCYNYARYRCPSSRQMIISWGIADNMVAMTRKTSVPFSTIGQAGGCVSDIGANWILPGETRLKPYEVWNVTGEIGSSSMITLHPVTSENLWKGCDFRRYGGLPGSWMKDYP